MLFGFKSSYETHNKTKKFFYPFYELWTNVNDIMVRKRQWMECPLSSIDAEEVDGMIKASIKTISKLQRSLSENPLAVRVLGAMGAEVGDLNEW